MVPVGAGPPPQVSVNRLPLAVPYLRYARTLTRRPQGRPFAKAAIATSVECDGSGPSPSEHLLRPVGIGRAGSEALGGDLQGANRDSNKAQKRATVKPDALLADSAIHMLFSLVCRPRRDAISRLGPRHADQVRQAHNSGDDPIQLLRHVSRSFGARSRPSRRIAQSEARMTALCPPSAGVQHLVPRFGRLGKGYNGIITVL